jgi:hypothetical protein
VDLRTTNANVNNYGYHLFPIIAAECEALFATTEKTIEPHSCAIESETAVFVVYAQFEVLMNSDRRDSP